MAAYNLVLCSCYWLICWLEFLWTYFFLRLLTRGHNSYKVQYLLNWSSMIIEWSSLGKLKPFQIFSNLIDDHELISGKTLTTKYWTGRNLAWHFQCTADFVSKGTWNQGKNKFTTLSKKFASHYICVDFGELKRYGF